MATAELLIAFDARIGGLETSLKRVTTALQNMKNTTDSTVKDIDNSVSSISSSFTRLIGDVRKFAAAWAIMRTLQISRDVIVAADDLNTSIRRLGSITSQTMPQAVSQFSQLLDIANRTGQPVQNLTESFTRFHVATRSIGATSADLTKFVDSMARFAQISGQGPQEAGAAITQLAQGLASGKLQGDELKSIMENMPQLAQALARELGVTTGELRKMGEEGKLTAENVFPAIIRAGQTLQTQLQGMPLSLRQAWTTVENSATSMIAAIDRRIGASEWLSKLLANLSSVMTAIGTRVEGTGEEAPRASRVANLNREMETARANATALRAQLAGLADVEAFVNADAAGKLAIRRRNPNIAAQVSGAPDPRALRARLQENERIVRDHRQTLDEIGQAADEEEIAARRRGNQERTEAEAAAARQNLRTVMEGGNKVLEARREHNERMARLNRDEISARADALNRLTGLAQGQELRRIQEEFAAGRAASAARRDREIASATAGERAAAAAAERERLQEANRRLREEGQAATQMQERINAFIRVGDQGASQIREALARWREPLRSPEGGQGVQPNAFTTFFQEAGGGKRELETGIRAITTTYAQAAQTIVREGGNIASAQEIANQALRDARAIFTGAGGDGTRFDELVRTHMGNAARAVETSAGKMKDDLNAIAQQGVRTFADQLSGAIIEFATTGEGKFEEMAANFAKMISKMILQLLIFNAMKMALGPSGLNLVSFRQAGGPVTANNPYIVGEAGPELFVPGVSGNIVPNHAIGGGGTTVNVYNNAPGTTSRQQERSDGMGGKEIDIYIEQVVQRGMTAGRFDDALGTSFGAQRLGRV